jgi:hypothetical protein
MQAEISAMLSIPLTKIEHSQAGFEALVRLNAGAEECFLDDIDVNMAKTSWFDADMCAAFGAILYRLGAARFNSVRVQNIPTEVEKILSRNGFLSTYGREKIPDRWGTTIPYKRFDTKDDRYFGSYIDSEFVRRSEMPQMSSGLRKKFHESIFEIFSNAVLHSQTKLGIFSCGQYYPTKHQLDFSVADLGIGIQQNIKEKLGTEMTPEAAILWATQGRNTTKRGSIPGGLGLKLLTEFIQLNGGRIQIVSGAGYWTCGKGSAKIARLSSSFPGTVVTLEVDTSDTQSYALASEVSASDIF